MCVRGWWMSLAAFLAACPDDALLAIAFALPSPTDILRLVLTCRATAQRFYFATTSYSIGKKQKKRAKVAAGTVAGTGTARQAETRSIAEEAARRWLMTCTEQERGWVPRRVLVREIQGLRWKEEPYMKLMWEVQALRRAAAFGQSTHYLTVSEGGALATRHYATDHFLGYRAVASPTVMRAGRHYAEFTIVQSGHCDLYFGVVRPRDGAGEGMMGKLVAKSADHCLFYAFEGYRQPGFHCWEGMERASSGDCIGLLLDLDEGSMTAFKNGKRLGMMQTSGLSGDYCWAVTLFLQGDSVRIEPAVTPEVLPH